jgi:hypothetical protein
MMKFDFDSGDIHFHVGRVLIGTICACVLSLSFCFCALMLTARSTMAILPAKIESAQDLVVRQLQDAMLRAQVQMDEREKRIDAAAQILRNERHELMLRQK